MTFISYILHFMRCSEVLCMCFNVSYSALLTDLVEHHNGSASGWLSTAGCHLGHLHLHYLAVGPLTSFPGQWSGGCHLNPGVTEQKSAWDAFCFFPCKFAFQVLSQSMTAAWSLPFHQCSERVAVWKNDHGSVSASLVGEWLTFEWQMDGWFWVWATDIV